MFLCFHLAFSFPREFSRSAVKRTGDREREREKLAK